MSTITTIAQDGADSPDNVAFAEAESVQLRMGLATAFTGAALAQVNYLLVNAASVIASECDKDEVWLAALTSVPSALRTTSIEMVVRVLQNPGGVRRREESLGSHSHGEMFADSITAIGLGLTDVERARCRRAIYGSTTSSSTMGSIVDIVAPDVGLVGGLYYLGVSDLQDAVVEGGNFVEIEGNDGAVGGGGYDNGDDGDPL